MSSIQQWLSGKKTYITCAAAIAVAIAAYASGNMGGRECIEAVLAALIAASLRSGITKVGN